MPLQGLTDASLYPSLEAAGGPVVVAFGTPGCGGCRRLRALLPALGEAVTGVDLAYAEAERCPGILADLEAFHLPAIWLFVDGDPWAPIQAPLRVAALTEAIAAALAGPPVD